MKLESQEKVFAQFGTSKVSDFGISKENAPIIMDILRNQIYTDKIKAVIRETSSNAGDANIENGIKDPIEVWLPFYSSLCFIVKDKGKGLSPEGIREVFTQYGCSTKRESNEFNGVLGIGSKSPFSKVDSFIVISYHGGFKRVYNCTLSGNQGGEVNLMSEEPCDETGLEIRVPVAPEDVSSYKSKVVEVLRYFKPIPTVYNLDSSITPPGYSKTFCDNTVNILSEYVYASDRKVRAWMGNVLYEIGTLRKIQSFNCIKDYRDLSDFISNLPNKDIHLYFNLGDIDFAPSREVVQFTEKTEKAIAKKLNDFKIETDNELKFKLDKSKITNIHDAIKEAQSIIHLQDFIHIDFSIIEDFLRSFLESGSCLKFVKSYHNTLHFLLKCNYNERYLIRKQIVSSSSAIKEIDLSRTYERFLCIYNDNGSHDIKPFLRPKKREFVDWDVLVFNDIEEYNKCIEGINEVVDLGLVDQDNLKNRIKFAKLSEFKKTSYKSQKGIYKLREHNSNSDTLFGYIKNNCEKVIEDIPENAIVVPCGARYQEILDCDDYFYVAEWLNIINKECLTKFDHNLPIYFLVDKERKFPSLKSQLEKFFYEVELDKKLQDQVNCKAIFENYSSTGLSLKIAHLQKLINNNFVLSKIKTFFKGLGYKHDYFYSLQNLCNYIKKVIPEPNLDFSESKEFYEKYFEDLCDWLSESFTNRYCDMIEVIEKNSLYKHEEKD